MYQCPFLSPRINAIRPLRNRVLPALGRTFVALSLVILPVAWAVPGSPRAVAQDQSPTEPSSGQQSSEQQNDAGPGKADPIALSPAPSVYPLDVAVDEGGTFYVADRKLHGVWKWSDGQLGVLFEGSPKFRTPLNAAYSIAIDRDGSVLVGDSATREVYRFQDGKPTPITGGKIGIPIDLAVSSDGTIYVADLELRQLVKIPPGTGEVEVVAKVNPRGVFIDAQDRVWVVSQDKTQLLIVAEDGSTEAVVGERIFEFPHQVVVNAAGEAFVSDGYKAAVWKVTKGNPPELFFSGAPLDNPVGLTLHDDQVVVVDPRAAKVFQFDASGKPTTLFEIAR